MSEEKIESTDQLANSLVAITHKPLEPVERNSQQLMYFFLLIPVKHKNNVFKQLNPLNQQVSKNYVI